MASRQASLEITMRGVVRGVEERTAAAERRVTRLADLLSREPTGADPGLLREFDRVVQRDSDGAWRSREDRFDPEREAGIFVPRFAPMDPEFRAFLMRAKHLVERFGAGTLDPRLADAWVSPDPGGQVIIVPDQPEYVRENSADEDYRDTDWMNLARPETNPGGAPRWTEPYHSVKTDAWYVSVVAPFRRGARWGGSVGQDLSWQELVDYSAQTPFESGGRFLLIGRNGGLLLADSATIRNPARPDGQRLEDLGDRELRDTLRTVMRRESETSGRAVPRVTRTSTAYVLYAVIPSTGWLLASVLPNEAVESPVRGPLRAMRFAVLLGLGTLMVASLIAITREIRRRQRIEEGTRRAEEHFRSLFQLSPDGVGVTELATARLIEVNDSFSAITGYSREEMIGRTTPELGLWERPADRDEAIATTLRDGECRNFLTLLRTKSGRVVEVTITARAIEMNGVACFLAIIRDVDEQRRMERQLTHALKMEAIGRLAGGVAHDFNNIMTAVMGYAQVASETLPEDSPAADDLREILRASGRAAGLTRQLLAFARRQVTQPRVLDLNHLVRETQKLLERVLGEDVRLVTRPADRLPAVRIDPGQLEQVLVNLSVNARDAMPRGGTLTISTGVLEGDVMLDVEDTGVGIPAEHQAVIFEPFFTTKEHGKGTGLGLASAYGIVRQSGGRIEVASEVGKGTRFRILLPALPEGTLPEPSENGAMLTHLTPGGGELVLLAEDEPQVRQLALRSLTGLGYKVMAAPNGEEALAMARNAPSRIDLLLTDVIMPGMTGEVLAAQLRALQPDIRVLYISGYADDLGAIEEALRQGDAFLPKPFTVSELALRVREVLDHEGPGPGA